MEADELAHTIEPESGRELQFCPIRMLPILRGARVRALPGFHLLSLDAGKEALARGSYTAFGEQFPCHHLEYLHPDDKVFICAEDHKAFLNQMSMQYHRYIRHELQERKAERKRLRERATERAAGRVATAAAQAQQQQKINKVGAPRLPMPPPQVPQEPQEPQAPEAKPQPQTKPQPAPVTIVAAKAKNEQAQVPVATDPRAAARAAAPAAAPLAAPAAAGTASLASGTTAPSATLPSASDAAATDDPYTATDDPYAASIVEDDTAAAAPVSQGPWARAMAAAASAKKVADPIATTSLALLPESGGTEPADAMVPAKRQLPPPAEDDLYGDVGESDAKKARPESAYASAIGAMLGGNDFDEDD